MVYQMVIYFMISKSKDSALWCNWRDYLCILERTLYLHPEKVSFCTKMKKMNCAFKSFHAKRAKWGYLSSKFVKHFIKIKILCSNFY